MFERNEIALTGVGGGGGHENAKDGRNKRENRTTLESLRSGSGLAFAFAPFPPPLSSPAGEFSLLFEFPRAAVRVEENAPPNNGLYATSSSRKIRVTGGGWGSGGIVESDFRDGTKRELAGSAAWPRLLAPITMHKMLFARPERSYENHYWMLGCHKEVRYRVVVYWSHKKKLDRGMGEMKCILFGNSSRYTKKVPLYTRKKYRDLEKGSNNFFFRGCKKFVEKKFSTYLFKLEDGSKMIRTYFCLG